MKIIANERVINYISRVICPSDIIGTSYNELRNCEDCLLCLKNNNISFQIDEGKDNVEIIVSEEEINKANFSIIIVKLLNSYRNFDIKDKPIISGINIVREEG